MAKSRIRETDLYPALKAHLEAQGYTVKGEVRECDVVAVRGDEEPVVVELKTSLNLTAILQAVERLAITSAVYIGVCADCPVLARQRRPAVKLLRMLGLGLVMIDTRPGPCPVSVLLDPSEYKPRKVKRRRDRLLGEFAKRVGDPNPGGMDRRRGIMTAYRQRALRIAEFLDANGPAKASLIAKSVDEPKARAIMYDDVYGWFERCGNGVYALSPRGREERLAWQTPETRQVAGAARPRRRVRRPS